MKLPSVSDRESRQTSGSGGVNDCKSLRITDIDSLAFRPVKSGWYLNVACELDPFHTDCSTERQRTENERANPRTRTLSAFSPFRGRHLETSNCTDFRELCSIMAAFVNAEYAQNSVTSPRGTPPPRSASSCSLSVVTGRCDRFNLSSSSALFPSHSEFSSDDEVSKHAKSSGRAGRATRTPRVSGFAPEPLLSGRF